jgi:hypothetical protein
LKKAGFLPTDYVHYAFDYPLNNWHRNSVAKLLVTFFIALSLCPPVRKSLQALALERRKATNSFVVNECLLSSGLKSQANILRNKRALPAALGLAVTRYHQHWNLCACD